MPDNRANQLKVELMENAFQPRDFQGMWFVLNAKYEALGWKDVISDEQRILEYKYVVQNFRRFLSNVKDEILECTTVDEMADTIEGMIDRAAQYGDTREAIVYNFVRDDWLYEISGYIRNRFAYEEEQDGK